MPTLLCFPLNPTPHIPHSLPMPSPPPLDDVLRSLHQERLLFFPIRHHSPACAWHVQQWILTEKPAAVLIEAPADATEFIPLLLHPQTQTPIALYTTYIDHDRYLDKLGDDCPEKGKPEDDLTANPQPENNQQEEPLRFGGYYPFCDYSPELAALRAGRRWGRGSSSSICPIPKR